MMMSKTLTIVLAVLGIVWLLDIITKLWLHMLKSELRGFDYDKSQDVLTINDMKFAVPMLKFLADEANSGDQFTILQKKDGVLSIEVKRGEEVKFVDNLIKDVTGQGENSV